MTTCTYRTPAMGNPVDPAGDVIARPEMVYDEGWQWCFHSATSLGALSHVQDFVERKQINVNKRNQMGWTALMYASFNGCQSIVNYLIEKKAQVDLKDEEGRTALILATMSGHASVVQKLLEHNCNVELRDKQGWSALFHACNCGFIFIIELLLKSGAAINSTESKFGYTPLMIAAKEGLELLVHTLINYGSDDSMISYTGETAGCLAMMNGHVNIASYLDLHADAKKNAAMSTTSDSLSHSLKSFLEKIGLSKYYPLLVEQEVDFPLFLTLTEEDLIEIGIKSLGPRRKIIFAIKRWHDNAPIGNSIEHSYADKLSNELILAQKEIERLKSELSLQQHKDRRKLSGSANL